MSSQTKEKKPFVLTQIEEALEERQSNDRRKQDKPIEPETEDRRKEDRRK